MEKALSERARNTADPERNTQCNSDTLETTYQARRAACMLQQHALRCALRKQRALHGALWPKGYSVSPAAEPKRLPSESIRSKGASTT